MGQAEPDSAFAFHQGAEGAIVDQGVGNRRDAAGLWQKVGARQHKIAGGSGDFLPRIGHPAERVDHLKKID